MGDRVTFKCPYCSKENYKGTYLVDQDFDCDKCGERIVLRRRITKVEYYAERHYPCDCHRVCDGHLKICDLYEGDT